MVRMRHAVAGAVLVVSLAACTGSGRPGSTVDTHPTTAPISTTTTAPSTTTSSQPTTNPTARLAVSSTRLVVGQPITVSGDDCPSGSSASAHLVPSTPTGEPAIFATSLSTGGDSIETQLLADGSDRVTTGPTGNWTISGVVPMVFPGSSLITARCTGEANPASPSTFLYPPLPVTVQTPFTLSVAPDGPVSPGATLTVQSNGGGCGAIASSPIVALYETSGTTQAVANTLGESTQPGSPWEAHLALPSDLPPGRYQLEADCDYSRGAIYGSYAPAEITVR